MENDYIKAFDSINGINQRPQISLVELVWLNAPLNLVGDLFLLEALHP